MTEGKEDFNFLCVVVSVPDIDILPVNNLFAASREGQV